jgi:hypothetical protein
VRRNLSRGLLLLGLLIMSTSIAQARGAQRGGTGLGLSLGDPTGLNFKTFLGGSMAFDATAGLGIIGGNHLALNAGLVWHNSLGNLGSAPVDWYYGVGAKLGYYDYDGNHEHDDHDDLRLGARAPLGVSVMLRGVPIDIFLEVAAGLWIVGNVDFDLDGAIGARYWF